LVNHLKQKMYKEQKEAMLIVWAVISVATALTTISPFFMDRQGILQNSPTCISKKQLNVDCFLCGMTRAFIEISGGNFRNANDLNNGSLYVYFSFVLNFIVFASYNIYKLRNKRTEHIESLQNNHE